MTAARERPRGAWSSTLVRFSAGFVVLGFVGTILRLAFPEASSPIVWAYVGITVIASLTLLVGLLRYRRRATRYDAASEQPDAARSSD